MSARRFPLHDVQARGRRQLRPHGTQEGEHNPLADVAAFKRFLQDIRDRCDEPPVATRLEEVGRYGSAEGLMSGAGTKDDPWRLKTPPQTSTTRCTGTSATARR